MVITNNPKFRDLQEKSLLVAYHDVTAQEILMLVRNHIHINHKILTHPLHSSLKPNETPYRTVVISTEPEVKVDFASVVLIEKALNTYEKFLKDKKVEIREEWILQDYQTIDYDLIIKAME